MHWVDEEITKRDSAEDRCEILNTDAPGVYEGVWSAVLDVVTHCNKSRQFRLKTNGNPRHRNVVDENEDRVLRIDLAEANDRIVATSRGANLSVCLLLVLDKTGVVQIVSDGKTIDYPAAAKEITLPFLFPNR